MTRLPLFNHPLLLGFEEFERVFDRISKSGGDGYPPYNIEQIGNAGIRITLAVAGFAMCDLSVSVEDSQLLIRGKQEDPADRVYLHRGIAARQFQRAFMLADRLEVVAATLDNGLLHVDLKRPDVEPHARTIPIRESAPRTNGKG
jgi:HSP20 family molecular chaperone IbpA